MKLNYPSITEEEFTEVLLSFLSSLKPYNLGLSKKEILLLTEFINLAPKYRSQMFSTLSKQKVIASLKSKGVNMSNAHINVKIYSMLRKGFLKRDEDSVIVLNAAILKQVEQFRAQGNIQFTLSFTRGKKKED